MIHEEENDCYGSRAYVLSTIRARTHQALSQSSEERISHSGNQQGNWEAYWWHCHVGYVSHQLAASRLLVECFGNSESEASILWKEFHTWQVWHSKSRRQNACIEIRYFDEPCVFQEPPVEFALVTQEDGQISDERKCWFAFENS